MQEGSSHDFPDGEIFFIELLLFFCQSLSRERRAARSDASHEQIVRFAKVPNLLYNPLLCLYLYNVHSDFSIFSDKNALSHRAVWDLYTSTLNHKIGRSDQPD